MSFVAVLGVVYGDFGTSPIYAFRECFAGKHPIPVTPDNALGILSLMFWTLILATSVQYRVYVPGAYMLHGGAMITPPPLRKLVQHTGVLYENTMLLTVVIEPLATASKHEPMEFTQHGSNAEIALRRRDG